MGPALQTRAHTSYSDPVTRVSRHLMRAVLGPGPESSAPKAFAARLWEVMTPLPFSIHTSEPPLRAHMLRARAHTSDIPIVPHVTRPRTCPPFTHASRTRTHAHTNTHGLPVTSSIRTLPASPLKALIDYDTPTLIHRHTLPHTCQPQTHIHKQGPRSTHAPSPTVSGALSHVSSQGSPLPCACRHTGRA